jgi:hypothetical protein
MVLSLLQRCSEADTRYLLSGSGVTMALICHFVNKGVVSVGMQLNVVLLELPPVKRF